MVWFHRSINLLTSLPVMGIGNGRFNISLLSVSEISVPSVLSSSTLARKVPNNSLKLGLLAASSQTQPEDARSGDSEIGWGQLAGGKLDEHARACMYPSLLCLALHQDSRCCKSCSDDVVDSRKAAEVFVGHVSATPHCRSAPGLGAC